jgi:hypothetical protein
MELKKNKSGWIAALLLAMLAMLLALPVSNVFAAGSVTFDDKANLLTSADKSAIQERAKGLNFDTIIVTRAEFTNVSSFTSYIDNYNAGSKTLTIGVESKLGRVQVDPGSQMGVTKQESQDIASSAASSYFSSKQWRNGIINILDSTNSRSSVNSSSSGGWIGWVIFGAIVVVIILLVAASRRRSGGRVSQPAYTTPPPVYMNQPGYGQPGYGQPMYPPPGYGPGYNNNQGSGVGNALLGGIAGFVIGEALSGGHGHNQGGYYQQQPGFFPGGGNNDSNDSGGASFGGGGDSGGGGGDSGGGASFGGGDSGGGGGDSSW